MKKKLALITAISLLLLCSCSTENKGANNDASDLEITSNYISTSESPLTTTSTVPTSTDNLSIADSSAQQNLILNNPDIRNLKWGMSVNDVIMYETEKNYKESVDNNSETKTLLTYSNVLFDGYNTEMTLCVTDGKGLDGVNYRIQGDKYKELYDKIYKEYGEPTSSDNATYASWDIEIKNYTIFLLKYTDSSTITQYSFFPINNDNNSDSSETASSQQTTNTATFGEQNALRMAELYLNTLPFSYKGLIEQLEFEGFSHSEAVYAVDNCGADWNEQASIKAKQYLDIMAFSRSSLIEQLEFDGFTHSQAVYGVEKNGY